MPRARRWAAFVAAVVAGSPAVCAQNAAAPAAGAPVAEATVPALPAAQPANGAPAQSAAGPIAALQQQLKQQGYQPGPVNGVMTEQTERALAAYQRRTGRPPDALAAAGAAGGDANPVRRAQAGLQRLGLFGGPLDGVVGPQTRDAIIRFEVGHHLAIDPRVSDGLLAALDKEGAAAATAAPPAAAPVAPQAPAPQMPEPQAASPEALGRQKLPSGVSPPPIR